MQELFGSTDWTPLLEVAKNKDGHIEKTGNFVEKLNYGAWEADIEALKEELRNGWREHLANVRKEAYEKISRSDSCSDADRLACHHSVC